MKNYKVKLKKLEAIREHYLIVTLERPDQFQFHSGQYVVFYLKDQNGSFERYFSIASSPSFNTLEFCVQTLLDGRGSAYFKSLKEGSEIEISEPQGRYKVADSNTPVVLIAGGSGISPMRSIVLDLLLTENRKHPVILLYGCKDSSAFPFKEELIRMSQEKDTKFILVLTAESTSDPQVHQGNVIEILKKNPDWVSLQAHFYACGPVGMMNALTEYLKPSGVLESQIFIEKY